MIKKITLFLFTVALISCSNPLDKKYSEATLKQDAKELKESNKMSDEDLQLLAGWILKSKLSLNHIWITNRPDFDTKKQPSLIDLFRGQL